MSNEIRFLVALVILYFVLLMLPARWAYALGAVLIMGFLAVHIQTAQALGRDLDTLSGVVSGG